MRIIHTADWHIGKLLCDYSLLDDQRFYFDRFIDDMSDLKPDAIIVAGDIYDRSIPSTDAVELLSDILSKLVLELKIPTIIIAGNHDSKERLSFATEFLRSNQLYIIGSLQEEIQKININNAVFYALPYYETYNARAVFSDKSIKTIDEATASFCKKTLANLDNSKINVMIAHGFYVYSNYTLQNDFAEIAGSNIVNASIFDPFDYVALGHIHSSRAIGIDKMRYSGSPLKYSIDEASHNKSYTIVDLDSEKKLTITQKSIAPLHDVRIINSSFSKLIDPQNNYKSDDYVHINLSDDNYILGGMSTLKIFFPNILGISYPNITYTTPLTVPMDTVKSKDNCSLFGDFFKQVNDCEISSQQAEIVKEIFEDIKKG